MTDAPFASRSFLIVDDMPLGRMNAVKLLEHMGVSRTFQADNGLSALDLLEGEAKEIDCIISDFHMPVMHGLQFLKAVRMGYKGIRPDMPFVMVTSHSATSLVSVAMVLDVSAFILKPPSKETLLKKLSGVFNDKTFQPLTFLPIDYACIDVDREIDDIDVPKSTVCLQVKKEDMEQLSVEIISKDKKMDPGEFMKEFGTLDEQPILSAPFDRVPVNSILVDGLFSLDGVRVLPEDTFLTRGLINKMLNYQEVGVKFKEVCYQSYRNK